MVTQGYTATLVATTLAISRSSLYYRKRPRGSRADRTYDEQIVVACGEKLAYGYRRVAWWLQNASCWCRHPAATNWDRHLQKLSSHTVGPMRAAGDFAAELNRKGLLESVKRVQAELYGSLALTGKGHGTDRAILLGLSGEAPDKVDPESIEPKLRAIRSNQSLQLGGIREIHFEESSDLVFHKDETLAAHSNGMRFRAFDDDTEISNRVYYSIGGGFILREGETRDSRPSKPVPYPFASADELLHLGHEHARAIWQIALENEKAWRSEEEIRAYVRRIWEVMQQCVQRGLVTEGILPGGLNGGSADPLAPMDWVNAFAMAVNEENAAGGRVVTAPTNGAAGVIPAVAHYYVRFVPQASDEGLFAVFSYRRRHRHPL